MLAKMSSHSYRTSSRYALFDYLLDVLQRLNENPGSIGYSLFPLKTAVSLYCILK